MATQLLAMVEGLVGDELRGPDGSGLPFGPAREAPSSACAADKLAAFLRRQV